MKVLFLSYFVNRRGLYKDPLWIRKLKNPSFLTLIFLLSWMLLMLICSFCNIGSLHNFILDRKLRTLIEIIRSNVFLVEIIARSFGPTLFILCFVKLFGPEILTFISVRLLFLYCYLLVPELIEEYYRKIWLSWGCSDPVSNRF